MKEVCAPSMQARGDKDVLAVVCLSCSYCRRPRVTALIDMRVSIAERVVHGLRAIGIGVQSRGRKRTSDY